MRKKNFLLAGRRNLSEMWGKLELGGSSSQYKMTGLNAKWFEGTNGHTIKEGSRQAETKKDHRAIYSSEAVCKYDGVRGTRLISEV